MTHLNLLEWHNLIFLISMGVGVMILVGSFFGLADFDGDFDVEADGDNNGASILDFGRVPFTIVLLIATMIFGATGFISNIAFMGFGVSSSLFGWISLLIALFVMTFFTGRMARILGKHLPSTETYNIYKSSFIGLTGSLIGNANSNGGVMDVLDLEKNTHRVICRTKSGVTFPNGKQVLVIDYNKEEDIFLIDDVA